MDRGSSFHSRGAATTAKDLSPHECLELGSINSNFSFDRKYPRECRNSTSLDIQGSMNIYSLINNE